MLAQPNRLTASAEFARATRRGRRCAGASIVVHLWAGPASQADASEADRGDVPPRAGFVVSKAVGGAVVRNTVTRRLRAVVRARLNDLPPGSLLVIRALPPAGVAPSARLAAELDACLARLLPPVAVSP